MIDQKIIDKLKTLLADDCIYVDALMSKHTSFKIGGPADLLLMPTSVEQVCAIYNYLRAEQITITWLGNGSNVLVSDRGIRGAVIALGERFSTVQVSDVAIVAQAGARLADVSKVALEHGLTGFEFADGIPGTIGGAAFMNAGAYGGEMKQVVDSVTALKPDGTVIDLAIDELNFRYRGSAIQDEGYIVLSVKLKLKRGDRDEIREMIDDLMQRRRDKQPLEWPSAGSTFKRPPGYYAGKLVQDAGLRGVRFGDAAVSEKHCGFVVNLGNATCADVKTLIAFIQKTVRDKYGVELETEVRIIGDFEGA